MMTEGFAAKIFGPIYGKYILVAFIALLASLGVMKIINKHAGLQDDHELEQQIENVIEHQTGMKIDLTPES